MIIQYIFIYWKFCWY